jgi:hypothetical protein
VEAKLIEEARQRIKKDSNHVGLSTNSDTDAPGSWRILQHTCTHQGK